MSSVAPRVVRLETSRLELRPFRRENEEPFAAMNADPEVMRYIGDGRPHDRPRAAATFERMRWHWAEHGFGRWAIERASDGAFLGFCGVGFATVVPEATRPEISWRFGRQHWGRGYATETAIASHRVMREIGMRRVDDLVTATHGTLSVHRLARADGKDL